MATNCIPSSPKIEPEAPSELDGSDDSDEPPFDADPDPEADELDDVEAAA